MKFTNPFRTPLASELAARDLADARRLLLDAQAKAEYNQHMVQFYTGMVTRLSSYIEESK